MNENENPKLTEAIAKVNVEAEVSPAKGRTDGILSPEQIKNWRKVLCTMIGPYAFIMPDSEVQKFRDKMQNDCDKIK